MKIFTALLSNELLSLEEAPIKSKFIQTIETTQGLFGGQIKISYQLNSCDAKIPFLIAKSHKRFLKLGGSVSENSNYIYVYENLDKNEILLSHLTIAPTAIFKYSEEEKEKIESIDDLLKFAIHLDENLLELRKIKSKKFRQNEYSEKYNEIISQLEGLRDEYFKEYKTSEFLFDVDSLIGNIGSEKHAKKLFKHFSELHKTWFLIQ